MSSKLKALGLGVLATLVVGAFAAINAGAETGGHIVSDSPTGSTIITGTEDETHSTGLGLPGLPAITCAEPTYPATMEGNTVTSINISPEYHGCSTEGGEPGSVQVHMNGCETRFTIGSTAEEHNTVDVTCPVGKVIELTHGASCTVHVPPAQELTGAAYRGITVNEKHAITLEVTLTGFKLNFEAGFCVLLGTSHEGEMAGSVTVVGFEDEGGEEGNPVNITAIGSED